MLELLVHSGVLYAMIYLFYGCFYNCPSLENIYVPIDKVNDYKAATNWNAIADKIKPMVPYTVVYNDN